VLSRVGVWASWKPRLLRAWPRLWDATSRRRWAWRRQGGGRGRGGSGGLAAPGGGGAVSINASSNPIGLRLHTPGLQPPSACNLLYSGAQSASEPPKAATNCSRRALKSLCARKIAGRRRAAAQRVRRVGRAPASGDGGGGCSYVEAAVA
jgi:hypothetical protein